MRRVTTSPTLIKNCRRIDSNGVDALATRLLLLSMPGDGVTLDGMNTASTQPGTSLTNCHAILHTIHAHRHPLADLGFLSEH
jgi:hypothetical protein